MKAIHREVEQFIGKCCEVLWPMVLEKPQLTLSPLLFFANNKKRLAFKEEIHKPCRGSDRNPSVILYFVWPCVYRKGIKMDGFASVVARENSIPQFKKGKKREKE